MHKVVTLMIHHAYFHPYLFLLDRSVKFACIFLIDVDIGLASDNSV